MAQTFTAQVKAFADKAKASAEAVVKQSAQEVFELAQKTKASQAENPKVNKSRAFDAGGNMPVDTGFLRNSFVAGLNGSTSLSGPDAYVMAIAGMELGDSVFGGWTANYARAVEYGTANMAGSFFALNAARQWQAVVAKNAALVKG